MASYRIGKTYRRLFDDPYPDPFVLIEGRRGTAKTATILKAMTVKALTYPGSRWLIARSTRVRLSESVIQTFDSHVLPSFSLPPAGTMASSRTHYDFPNRSRFIFMALDDPGRSQSVEADGAYISEGVELPTLESATALVGAIRPRMTAALVGDDTPLDPFPNLVRQVLIDCNPGAPGHWLNKIAEPVSDAMRIVNTRDDHERLFTHNMAPSRGGWKRVVTTMADNPGYWDREAWTPNAVGRRYIEGLGYMPPWRRKQWIEGIWTAADGAVFPEFSTTGNVVPDFPVPETWPVYLCADPGYFHPCGVSWNTISPNGTRYTISEIKVRQTTLDRLVELINAKGIGVTSEYCDPAGKQQRQEADGKSFIQLMANRGHKFSPWPYAAKEDHDASVQAHRQAIVDKKYKVFASCVETIAEHQSWEFKVARGGEMLSGDDQYQDSNNDLLDGILGGERAVPMFDVGRITVHGVPQSRAQPPRQETL